MMGLKMFQAQQKLRQMDKNTWACCKTAAPRLWMLTEVPVKVLVSMHLSSSRGLFAAAAGAVRHDGSEDVPGSADGQRLSEFTADATCCKQHQSSDVCTIRHLTHRYLLV